MGQPLKFNFGHIEILLKYSHGILSPSPFSRLLASTLVDYIPSVKEKMKSALDIGSGSGIQSILLAKLGIKDVYAVDIDPRAVAATEFNALLNEVSEWRPNTCCVNTFQGNMFDPLSSMKFDLIISNAPSLPSSEDTPKFASGGSYPQEFLDKLINKSVISLKPNGKLIFTLSSLAGLKRTEKMLNDVGFSFKILQKKQERFRDFYYPHISYYRKSQLDGITNYKVLPNGELAETIYIIEASL
jgi:methylase of polypeptide subunit release factors